VPEEPKDNWLKRKINELLGWILDHLLRFLAPLVDRLWHNLSVPGRTVVIICASLLLLFFLALIARSLVYSRFIQRGLDASSSLTIKAATPVRWIDRADEAIRGGDYRSALTCLYRWLIAWVTDHNVVGRHQWWTNRQLIGALSGGKHEVTGVARDIVSRYEDTEYGHRSVDLETISGLRDKTRTYISGGRL
jgi:hypothetical protein